MTGMKVPIELSGNHSFQKYDKYLVYEKKTMCSTKPKEGRAVM